MSSKHCQEGFTHEVHEVLVARPGQDQVNQHSCMECGGIQESLLPAVALLPVDDRFGGE